jgi:hypothetical protein
MSDTFRRTAAQLHCLKHCLLRPLGVSHLNGRRALSGVSPVIRGACSGVMLEENHRT